MKVYHYHHHHILNGVDTNVMSRSPQNVLTNFSILRRVVMGKKTDVRKFKIQTTALIPYKIKSWFGAKDPIPAGLRTRVIYKFSCADGIAFYIGETNRHLATRNREHLSSDKHSHIFKHLWGTENCHSLCSDDYFKILDSASTSFQFIIGLI